MFSMLSLVRHNKKASYSCQRGGEFFSEPLVVGEVMVELAEETLHLDQANTSI